MTGMTSNSKAGSTQSRQFFNMGLPLQRLQ
jgi:hypothetical protein